MQAAHSTHVSLYLQSVSFTELQTEEQATQTRAYVEAHLSPRVGYWIGLLKAHAINHLGSVTSGLPQLSIGNKSRVFDWATEVEEHEARTE